MAKKKAEAPKSGKFAEVAKEPANKPEAEKPEPKKTDKRFITNATKSESDDTVTVTFDDGTVETKSVADYKAFEDLFQDADWKAKTLKAWQSL